MTTYEPKLKPIHPGEILKEEFMKPLGLSISQLSKDTGLHGSRLSKIILGKRRITADTALRLASHFKMSPEFWMNAQSHYDLEVAKEEICWVSKELVNAL